MGTGDKGPRHHSQRSENVLHFPTEIPRDKNLLANKKGLGVLRERYTLNGKVRQYIVMAYYIKRVSAPRWVSYLVLTMSHHMVSEMFPSADMGYGTGYNLTV